MRDSDWSAPPAAGDTALPDLVDAYRARRDVLEAEMRELTRRRDEIRTAAEREAQDIVEAARRDVQRTLTAARQQLIVLAGQVQAAMEPLQPATAARERARFEIDDSLPPGTLDIEAEPLDLDVLVEARRDVHGIFEVSRPELEGLQDAVRALARGTAPDISPHADPFGVPSGPADAGAAGIRLAVPTAVVAPPEPARKPAVAERPAPMSSGVPSQADEPEAPVVAITTGVAAAGPADDANASAAPAAPTGRLAEGSALPVHRPGLLSWLRAHPSAGWVAAVLVLTVLIGWYPRRGVDGADAADPDVLALESDAPAPNRAAAGPEPAAAVPMLRLEARRQVWVQLTVDGQRDVGQTLQPGERHDIDRAREVDVLAGDAGALWLSVNGGALEAFGADGRVLRRQIPLIPLTPAPPTSGSSAVRTRPEAAAAPAAAASSSASPNRSSPRADAVPARAVSPAPAAAAPEAQIVTAAERWFEAYYRRQPFDAFGNVQHPVVADSRSSEARLPEGLREIDREFDQVQVQVVADTAIYSARMVERSQAGAGRHEAHVSQVWVRQGNGWQLMDVRLVSEPRRR